MAENDGKMNWISKPFFPLACFAIAACLLAGCVQPPQAQQGQPSASQPPEGALGLNGFAQTAEELSRLAQGAVGADDKVLVQSNELFLAYKDDVKKLDALGFDCADYALHEANAAQLQGVVDEGKAAVALMPASSKKDYWTGYFDSMQMQADAYAGDLAALCPNGANTAG